MERNAVMSEAMYYILLVLGESLHGYAITNATRILSGGRINLSLGTLYGILTRMQVDAYIKLDKETDRRKYYIITKAGKKALKNEYLRLFAMLSDSNAFILGMKS